MKYSYLLTGIFAVILVLIFGVILIINNTNIANSSVPILSLVGVLVYAAICFYYSSKPEKINFFSNTSRNLLWITIVITILLTIGFLSEFNTAREATQAELFYSFLGKIISRWGSIISLLLIVVSLFVKKSK